MRRVTRTVKVAVVRYKKPTGEISQVTSASAAPDDFLGLIPDGCEVVDKGYTSVLASMSEDDFIRAANITVAQDCYLYAKKSDCPSRA